MFSMQYIFLIVAAAWGVQFALAYWQLRRFHRRIAELRKLGRCSVGLHGDRWRGRTYAVLAIDRQDRVLDVEVFRGWTVLAQLRPIEGLAGMRLDAILGTATPPPPFTKSQWLALQNAASYFKKQSPPAQSPNASAPDTVSAPDA
jgi:DNA-binding transcriptional regulator of glucitol operon